MESIEGSFKSVQRIDSKDNRTAKTMRGAVQVRSVGIHKRTQLSIYTSHSGHKDCVTLLQGNATLPWKGQISVHAEHGRITAMIKCQKS